jgi:cytochrome c oxidase subunit 2
MMTRRRWPFGLPLVGACLLCCAACGGGSHADVIAPNIEKAPAYVTAPPTPQQRLVSQGARLFVSDGCSACHAIGSGKSLGPGFAQFAGNRVMLADGHRVTVDEGFLRRALTDPTAEALKGYPLAPMVDAVRRLGLAMRRSDVDALAAFIEQIGPE